MAATKKAKSKVKTAPSGPKKKQGKAKKSKDLWSYFTPLMVALLILPLALVFIVFTQRIQPDATQSFSARNDLVLDVFKNQVQQELNNFVEHVSKLSQLDSVQSQLQSLEEPITVDLGLSIKNGEQYVLFPRGNHRPNENNEPPITFIMINNAFNASRSGNAIVEFDQNYLYVTEQVKTTEGKTLGALTAAIPKETLFTNAYNLIENQVAVQILQVIEQTENTIFQSNGWQNDTRLHRDEKFHDVFRLKAHWIGQGEHSFLSEHTLIGIALAIGIISILIAWLCALLFKQAMTNDLEMTRDAIIDLFRGKKPTQERFHLQNVAETYENIYDNLKNSAALTNGNMPHQANQSTPTSLFNQSENEEPEPVEGKSNYSREQYAMEVVEKSTASDKPKTSSPTSTEVSETIFRAYDIRGIYPSELNEGVVEAIGKAIGSAAIAAGTREITIARDGRTTGPTLIKSLRKGLKKTGIVVIDIGMVPTPLLYFAAKKLTQGSGVMLTGSHNPPDYNGLKIMIAGETLYGDAIRALYTRVQTQDFEKGTGQVIEKDIMSDYESELIGDIVLSRALKVVVDCGNGVTGVMMPQLLEQLGVDATGIFTEVDGTFPNHAPDPSQPANMVSLIEEVKKQGADLGLAFDGDGDRVGVITPAGKMVFADKLMMLFSEHVLAANPGQDIIFDVKCSSDLAQVIRNSGGRPVMWKTGHSLIKAKLRETKAPLAGEMSGHIFFNDRWNGSDDALYAAARLLEMLSSTTENLDKLLSRYPERTSTPELHVAVTDESKFDIIKKLVAEGSFGNGKSNEIDGLRVDFEKGWGILRASNTTPVLVARFEAESEEVLNMIQSMFRENLQAVAPDIKISF